MESLASLFVPTCPSADLVGSEARADIPLIDRVHGPTITNTRTTVGRQASDMSSTPTVLHHRHNREERKTSMDSTGTRVASTCWICSVRYVATACRAIGERTSYVGDSTKRTLPSLARVCFVDSLYRCA